MIRAEQEITLSRVDDGANGATFIPSVDAAGDISWTNDKGLPNPATQNIKGPAGDDANIWTTSTAPTTPNYTFTISNLTGGSGSVKVGDIILYSYYRYTVTSVSTTTVLAGLRTSLRGATGTAGKWYTGTGITGTSTTATIFSGSGVSSAVVGDMYLNTSTNNTYRCTTAGNASTAKWVYVCNIKGDTGSGVTISNTSIDYVVSNSGTSTPSSGWQSTVPAAAAGEYIWTRTIVNYSDGSSTTSYSVARQGEDTTSAYVKYIDATYGVRVYSSSGTPNNYVQISPNSVSVWKGGVQVSSFGDTAVVGPSTNGYSRIEVNSSGIDLIRQTGASTYETLAHIGYGSGASVGGGTGNAPYFTFGTTRDSVHGNYSLTAGAYNKAAGPATAAIGCGLIAGASQSDTSSGQVVVGRYNVADNNGAYAFIVGNGTNEPAGESNAFTVNWQGIAAFGDVPGTFKVQQCSGSRSQVSSGSTGTITATDTLAGYYPVAIAGFNVDASNARIYEVKITSAATGSVTVTCKFKAQGSVSSGTSYFDVLWVKVA